jgi:hypothetical protein
VFDRGYGLLGAQMRTLRLLASILTFGVVGCSFLLDSGNEKQCVNSDDCLKRGPDFQGTICETNPGPSLNSCVPTPPQNECASNLNCDIGSICIEGAAGLKRCQRLDLSACTRQTEDPRGNDVLIIGMLADIGPNDPEAFDDSFAYWGAELAIKQFNTVAGGFPSISGMDRPKRAMLLGCSQATPRTSASALAQLGAVAIVGPTRDSVLTAAAEQTVPRSVPLVGGWISDTNTPVARASGRVWATGPLRSELFEPLKGVLEQAATAIKQQVSTPAASTLRVAVISDVDNFASFGPLADERLVFNGKSALENQNDASCNNCYKRFVLGKNTAAEIASFAPNVVIPYTSAGFGYSLLPNLETAFRNAALKPVYIVPFAEEDDGFARTVTDRKRLLFLGQTQSSTYASFANQFREAYGVKPTLSAAKAYEATQLILYGVFSTTQAKVVKVDGQATMKAAPGISALNFTIALSDARVTSRDTNVDVTPRVNAGVTELNETGLPALKGGKDIHYNGLLSPLDMETIRFSAEGAFTLYCMNAAGDLVSTTNNTGTGATKGKFEKAVTLCP